MCIPFFWKFQLMQFDQIKINYVMHKFTNNKLDMTEMRYDYILLILISTHNKCRRDSS